MRNIITTGKTLHACNRRLQDKEVLPQVTRVRSVTQGYISNSSNLSNKENYATHSKKQDQKQTQPMASATSQSTSSANIKEHRQSDIAPWIREIIGK